MHAFCPPCQRGSISIEFALTFVLILVVFYAIVGYSIPLLLSASFENLASSTLREAVEARYTQDMAAEIENDVEQAITRSWIPPQWVMPCSDFEGKYLKVTADVWRVCLGHGDPAALMPSLSLFGWKIPRLPSELRAEAAVRVR